MFGVVKYHEDAFVFEDNLYQANDVGVIQLAAEAHLSYSTLGDACVTNLFTFLVGLELFDGDLVSHGHRRAVCACDDIGAVDSLVHAAVRTTTNESHDAVSLRDTNFGLVSSRPAETF